MRGKRHKRARKVLAFYEREFQLHAPYRVLLDADIIQAAIKGRIQLARSVVDALQSSEALPFVTTCVLADLKTRGEPYAAAAYVAGTLRFLKCRHAKKARRKKKWKTEGQQQNEEAHANHNNDQQQHTADADQRQETKTTPSASAAKPQQKPAHKIVLSARDCIAHFLKPSKLAKQQLLQEGDHAHKVPTTTGAAAARVVPNPDSLVIGAQDPELRQHIRDTCIGIPILTAHSNLLVLESPNHASTRGAAVEQRSRAAPRPFEVRALAAEEARVAPPEQQQYFRKRAKAPNPLAVKRKKKRQVDVAGRKPSAHRMSSSVAETMTETIAPNRRRTSSSSGTWASAATLADAAEQTELGGTPHTGRKRKARSRSRAARKRAKLAQGGENGERNSGKGAP